MIILNAFTREDWPESLRPLIRAAERRREISVGGAQLAKLRRAARTIRRQRIYTGVVGGRRAWRHMKVILADGRIAELFMAKRGVAVVTWMDEFAVRPNKIGACRTDELRPFKLPSAVLLGSLKRGIIEKPSLRKAKAAQINGNGSAPVREGSRPRGRPKGVLGKPGGSKP